MNEISSVSARQDEDRRAFLRYLPKRIEAFEQRISRYAKVGWDSGGMMVLRGDVQRLAETSGRYNLTDIRRNLLRLTQRVGDHLARRTTPDADQTAKLFEMLTDVVSESQALLAASPPPAAPVEPAVAIDVPRVVPDAPEGAETAQPPPVAAAPLPAMPEAARAAPVSPAPVAPPPAPPKPAAIETGASPPTPAAAPPSAETPRTDAAPQTASADTGVRRIYHLGGDSAFGMSLEQRLESEGYAVEPIATLAELTELVQCLPPHTILVDAAHLPSLAAIDALRRDAQQRLRPHRPIHLAVMAAQDTLEARRAAHRADTDLVLTPPYELKHVVERLNALHASTTEEKVRVLIVEDNRADAFYAQTVLTNAGMLAHVENDPSQVIDSLRLLHPDLILMDLHMPFANGVEVTLLIREHPIFSRVPIVFLSGESDPDSRLEAINAGGDDFLFKPIRPKHLVAAVRDRMRRMHPAHR